MSHFAMDDDPHTMSDDDDNEYIYVEIEEEPSQDEEESSGDVEGENKNDLFYIVRHGKLNFLRKRMDQQPILKVNTQNNTRITPLMSATISRRHGIIKFFLSRPEINVNAIDDHHMSALLYAANNGDQLCLSYLLNAGANVAHVNTESRNFLHTLILRKHVYTALYALDYKDPVIKKSILTVINGQDYLGMTPLLYACELGRLDLVKFLLYQGADPTITDLQGLDAFCHALRSKDPSLVHYFIKEMKSNVNHIYTYSPPVKPQSTETVIDLYNISSPTTDDELMSHVKTPLFYAVDVDSPHLIRLLLDNGANIHFTDSRKETPFLYACRFGKISAMFELLYRGANPNDRNMDGATAILHLIKHDLRDELKYVIALSEKKLQTLLTVDEGINEDKLHEAITPIVSDKKLYETLRTAQDDKKRTAIMHSVFSDNGDALSFLIHSCNCDITARDDDGKTALYHAVERRHVKLFELLIDAGADVNTRDQDNNTVLMHAADSNNIQFLSSLLFKNAEVEVLNNRGWSVLTFSCKTGNDVLFTILLKHILSLKSTSKLAADRLLSVEHLSLCLNVACVYARPAVRRTGQYQNHSEIIKTLLHQQRDDLHLLRGCAYANPNLYNPGLELPIIAAVRHSGNNVTIVKELLESSSIVNILVKDEHGDNPALIAVKNSFDQVMRELFVYELKNSSKSPSSTSICSENMSIIHHACVRRYYKCFQETVKRCPVNHLLKAENDFGLRAVEFMVLGPKFRHILPLLRAIKYPLATDQATPQQLAKHNDPLLSELDYVYLNVIEEQKLKGVDMSEMTLFKEYNNFVRSIKLSEDFVRSTNECRPSLRNPTQFKNPIFTKLYSCIIATRNFSTFKFFLETRPSGYDPKKHKAPEEPGLRTDYVDDFDNTLAEVLFAMAGYDGSSVEGTKFLFKTIRYVKMRPHLWHPTHLFRPPQGLPVRGKSIEQLALDYNIPYAWELMCQPAPVRNNPATAQVAARPNGVASPIRT